MLGCKKELNIKKVQKKLEGEWQGVSNSSYFSNEKVVNFTIESDGHYYAYLVGAKGGIGNNTVLYNGNDELDNEDKKIIIMDIDDHDQSATGKINFVHHSFGELLTYGISDLKFSHSYKKLSFKSGRWPGEHQTIQYDLIKQ